jgi:hypothetical protein
MGLRDVSGASLGIGRAPREQGAMACLGIFKSF